MSGGVLIVGAGPVGLITALILAKAGVSVTVIESEAHIVKSPRAMTYAWPANDGLKIYGLFEDMQAAGCINHDRAFRVFETGEMIVFTYDAIKEITDHPFTITLGQDGMAEVLLVHLARYPNVTIRWSTRFTGLEQHPDHVVVSAATPNGPLELSAHWVIAADGGRSDVRKALKLSFDGVTWPRRFVATNVYYDFERYGWVSGYLLDPVYGAVVARINHDGLWRVTYSEDERLPFETAGDRIDAYMKHMLPGPKTYDLALHSAYSMHQRTAPTYRVGRVLLAGDAAHVTNPTSGFGLVGGMFDAFALGEALAAVVDGVADDSILDRYADARRKVYLNVTSPISADSMRLVFYCDDKIRLEHDLITLRARKEDEKSMRASLMAPMALETPSLVTGKTLSQTRASLATSAR